MIHHFKNQISKEDFNREFILAAEHINDDVFFVKFVDDHFDIVDREKEETVFVVKHDMLHIKFYRTHSDMNNIVYSAGFLIVKKVVEMAAP